MERSRNSFLGLEETESEEDPPRSGAIGESINALAARVLFSPSLAEKLRPISLDPDADEAVDPFLPRTWKDFRPDRPEGLGFASASETRPSLPSRPGLIDEKARGVLLHFFANHELLAAELMALALLKFPDAPAEFRRGLASTLREEQRHTRWYLNRMRECGLEFGTHPLSPYFWEAVSPMESPIDYVSRLSLTFEQANLDYARHFGNVLAEVGDERSAAILRRIYEDEIGHVGYGLHWFRHWKDPRDSDWDALRKVLHFPLSPSRAKGNRTGFNAEGRREAGFDEDYIRRLSLFERSKGRTPNVFHFNPEAEHRIGRWPAEYHPDSARLAIIRDLESLTGYLARRDDVILLRRPPSDAHLAKLAACGLALPEIESLDDRGGLSPDSLIARRKINRFRPWSVAPDLSARFPCLKSVAWDPRWRELFSKVSQTRELAPWMGPSVPLDADTSFAAGLGRLRAEGHRDFVLKRAFSTAGSGMRILNAADIERLTDSPLQPAILDEGGILLEPRHDRVFDFSVQYWIEAGEIRLLGFVEQIINGTGGYRGSICRTKFCKGFEPELARLLMGEAMPLYQPGSDLARDLLAWATRLDYQGPLGVDAYVHRDQERRLTLRPICEVNPRHTMGRVALELKRRVAPGRDLAFFLLRTADRKPEHDMHEVDESGRLEAGSVILTEPQPDSVFVARCEILRS